MNILRRLKFICHFNSTTKKAKIKKWIKIFIACIMTISEIFLHVSVINQWSIRRRKYFSLSALFTLPHQNQAKEKFNEYFFASKVFVFLLHIANHRLSVIKPRAPPNHKLSTYNTNVDRLTEVGLGSSWIQSSAQAMETTKTKRKLRKTTKRSHHLTPFQSTVLSSYFARLWKAISLVMSKCQFINTALIVWNSWC